MQSITREALIDRLTELEPRERVEPAVNGAIEALGWEDKPILTATEVIALGTVMAELARTQFAASSDPALKRAAREMEPLVTGLRHDVLPVLADQPTKEAP